MAEKITLASFCAALILCVALGASILYALLGGLAIFLIYGKIRGKSWRQLGKMTLSGVASVRNVLMTFMLIGMLTALWRAAGTIPLIVGFSARLIRPHVLLVMSFVLCSAVSLLTGTSFGTSATMGVICATVGSALGVDPRYYGGAILAGAFFGDRCSPVSTSALLTSELTETNIFDNIRNMMKTALVPFVLSCAFYTVLGFAASASGAVPDLYAAFSRSFELGAAALLPAIVILACSVFKLNVKISMLASIISALAICLLVQKTPIGALPRLLVMGFESKDPETGEMLSGGGIISMLRVSAIICLSSSYSGIFRETGLLDGIKRRVGHAAGKTSPYFAMLIVSLFTGMAACNQVFSIMLTKQLSEDLPQTREELALNIEDTAVLTAALVPWSIASGVPLSSAGAPDSAILFAVFLYLLPVCRLCRERLKKRKCKCL